MLNIMYKEKQKQHLHPTFVKKEIQETVKDGLIAIGKRKFKSKLCFRR